MSSDSIIVGETRRTLDERFRVSLPAEMASAVCDEAGNVLVSKERFGCLSLWNATVWQRRLDQGLGVIRQKIQAGKLEQRWPEVQRLGRLLSTRHRVVALANRSRLLIPEGFREFLDVAVNQEVVIVGAVVCVELWSVPAWIANLKEEMPGFTPLFEGLSE